MPKYTISVFGNLAYGLSFGQAQRVQTPLNVTIEFPVDLTNGISFDPTYAKKLARINAALDKATTLVVNRRTLTLVAGDLIVKYGVAGKEKTPSFSLSAAKDLAAIKTFINNNAPRSTLKSLHKPKL